ncbi:MAG: hypothetical protein ACREYB_05195 [Casimicrobiaceae bacterium]
MPAIAVPVFPEGTTFFNVEGVPVAVTPRSGGKGPLATAFDPGKPPRPFPLPSVLRNGSPVTEARFRDYADLPADGIPVLRDDDPINWNTAAAADVERIAAEVIAGAARH